jgi:allophanate hydrolase subunit 2
MDREAAANANALIGNAADAAVIEMILKGITLKFEEPTVVAVAGHIARITLNEMAVESGTAIKLNQGDILKIGTLKQGHFAYLAIQGGWQTRSVLGSQSMYQGITEKGMLFKNDTLEYQTNLPEVQTKSTIDLNYNKIIPASRGPEYEVLPDSFQKLLQQNEFDLSSSWNRMGYTFDTGSAVAIDQIQTAPVLPGTVQLTPSGKLIILMRDAQTTGGYPRVLQLDEPAINQIARLQVGSSIKFKI